MPSSLSEPQLWTGLGAAFAIFLSALGSAIASAEGGVYALRKHGLTAFIPIIIAGVLAIYGIVIAVLLAGKIENEELTTAEGYRNLSAGLAVGFGCLASGMGMTRFLKHQNKTAIPQGGEGSGLTQPLVGREERPMAPVGHENFIYLTLVMVFLEAIGLYGLIAGLFLMGK